MINLQFLAQLLAAIIWFNASGMRTFKRYVHLLLPQVLSRAQLSYSCWCWWRQRLSALIAVLAARICCKPGYNGRCFIDSTALPVCKIQRERDHKCFSAHATKSRSSLGWFYGFKLHLVCAEGGGVLRYWVTTGKTHDVTALSEPGLLEGLTGELIADSGYQGRARHARLKARGLTVLAKPSKLREADMPVQVRQLFRKRWRIETTIGQLKEHFDLASLRPCRCKPTFDAYVHAAVLLFTLEHEI